jgi:hypothetical protein
LLILTPLTVAYQFIREGEKFGRSINRSKDGNIKPGITVANYERLHYFNPNDFDGVVCDEASAIKSFDGKRRKEVTRFMSKMKYRLLGTATPAPNDFIELGTLSEALGYLGQIEMLGMYFRNDDKTVHQFRKDGDFWNSHKWFFKAHAEIPFWRWVCSWARAIRKPSDLGPYDDTRFILPRLDIEQHVVKTGHLLPGELFPVIACTLSQQREERRITMDDRCAKVAELVAHDKQAVVWCHLNPEGDLLEKMIPGSVQVAGCDSDDDKEDRLTAFTQGKVRVLVTKQKIGGWGLNWQHCGHHVFFPSHSFEGYYQAIRRSYRFGRTEPVKVDIVTTEGEAGVTENLKKKQINADAMFNNLVAEMNNALGVKNFDNHTKEMEPPVW